MLSNPRRLFGGLTTRLVLLAGLPLLVTFVIGYGFYHLHISPQLQESMLHDLRIANRADTQAIESQIRQELRVLGYLAQRPEARSADGERLRPELERALVQFREFDGLVLADRNGAVVFDSNRGGGGGDGRGGGTVADREYFKKAMAGTPVVSSVIETRTSGKSMVIVAHPVVSVANEPIGVLFGPLDSLTFYRVLHREGAGLGGGSFVIDGAQRVVTGSAPGTHVSTGELPSDTASASYTNHRGSLVYGVREPIQGTDWEMVTEASAATVQKGFTRYNRVLFSSILLALLLATIAAGLVAATIRVPLGRLRALSERVGKGQQPLRAARMPPCSPWQITELHETIVEMAGQVEEQKNNLREALEEKSVLLREVNHRVRNNLAVIQGILSLKRQGYCEDSEPNVVLRDSQNRVAAIAVVHDLLYNTDNIAQVDVIDYAPQLVEAVQTSFNKPEIHVATNFESIVLPANLVIPAGMILNELVTNAYRHAFPEGRGTIVVESRRHSAREAEFRVKDDGIGVQSRGVSTGIGSDLMRELARQIDGTIHYVQNSGTDARLHFPVPDGSM
jgi:two-component sensor histidine kinase